ncbi:MAG TPA: DUF2784 domain-containing protein [Gammaproteobacteria bacterium]
MHYLFLANAVALLHFLFILFVVFGGLLVFWKPWFAWIHIPVAIYGVLIEWVGWVCPLTPLENRLRERAGQSGYEGGFVEEYLLPLIYPEGFTRNVALVLGAAVLLINLAIYVVYLLKRG